MFWKNIADARRYALEPGTVHFNVSSTVCNAQVQYPVTHTLHVQHPSGS